MSKPTPENTAFYSTADAGYAIYSATSLLTVRDHLPEAKLCLLSSGLSDYDKKILKKNDIEYEEFDLRDRFTKVWDYPIEAYYIFSGPELLLERGFEYSAYIDGDVLCRANPLEGMPEIKVVAGVASRGENGVYSGIFGDDWGKIKKLWRLSPKCELRKRVNAGIVYFNNRKMADIGLLDKATNLFQRCLTNGIPRKGDDSLFSLLQYAYLDERDVKIMEPRYNFVLQFNEWHYPVEELVFFHFSMDKPWKPRPYRHEDSKLDIFNPYVRLWRARLRRTAPRRWARTCLSGFAKAIGLHGILKKLLAR